MKKIIVMITLLAIMMGCGKTARPERDRLEAAQEQSRLASEVDQSKYKGVWECITTHVRSNKGPYGIGAAITVLAFVGIPAFYHYCIYKKPALEDESDHIFYDQKKAAEDFYKENPNLKPIQQDGKPKPPAKMKINSDIDNGIKEAMKPTENVKEGSLIKEEPKVQVEDNTSDEEAIPIKHSAPKKKAVVIPRNPPIKIDTYEEHKKRMDDGRKLRKETG
jgi:hypothetical protein